MTTPTSDRDEDGEKLADAYDLDIQADALRKAADAWENLGQPDEPSPIGVWLRCRATQLENASEQLRDSIPGPASACQILDVDGDPVRVQADPDMPAEVRAGLEDVIRTVRRNHSAPAADDLRDRIAEAIGDAWPVLRKDPVHLDQLAATVLPVVEEETAAPRLSAEQAEADLAQVNKYLVSGGVTRTGAQGVLDLLHMLAAEQERHQVARQEWKRCLALLRQTRQQAEQGERERDEARAAAGFALAVLALFDQADSHSELFWRVDAGEARLYANVSDVFAWGTADLEEIIPDRLPILQQAYDDLIAVDSAADLAVLYAARVRGQRPQGAAYPDHPTVRVLLDECGPERPLGVDNPRPPAALDRPEAPSDGR